MTSTITPGTLTTDPAHNIAYTINQAGRVKAFVQHNGNLRVRAHSCAAAKVEIDRACRRLGIRRTVLDVFEVRFIGSKPMTVLTYPMEYDPMRAGVDRRTGALLNP